jgi:hypothetical protein
VCDGCAALTCFLVCYDYFVRKNRLVGARVRASESGCGNGNAMNDERRGFPTQAVSPVTGEPACACGEDAAGGPLSDHRRQRVLRRSQGDPSFRRSRLLSWCSPCVWRRTRRRLSSRHANGQRRRFRRRHRWPSSSSSSSSSCCPFAGDRPAAKTMIINMPTPTTTTTTTTMKLAAF